METLPFVYREREEGGGGGGATGGEREEERKDRPFSVCSEGKMI